MVASTLPKVIYGLFVMVIFLSSSPIAQIPLNVQQPYGTNLGLVPFYNASGFSPFQQQQQAFQMQGGYWADRRALDGMKIETSAEHERRYDVLFRILGPVSIRRTTI